MLDPRRATGDLLAVLSPVLSGFAVYLLTEWSPKTWVDPACGIPDWVLVTYIPLVALPPLFAAFRLRRAGRRWATVISVGLAVLAVTIGTCLVALYFWFVKHNCGE
jgi:hypothetical protein